MFFSNPYSKVKRQKPGIIQINSKNSESMGLSVENYQVTIGELFPRVPKISPYKEMSFRGFLVLRFPVTKCQVKKTRKKK